MKLASSTCLVLALLLAGCPSTPATTDAGTSGGTDTGTSGTDTGTGGTDTGTAGTDTGTGGTDAGPPGSLACSASPFTLTLGSSIGATTLGVVLCMEPSGCRVTNNTYSDGDGACPNASSAAFISVDSGPPMVASFTTSNSTSGYTTTTCDVGTPLGMAEWGYTSIPLATPITCVIEAGDGTLTEVVFSFTDATTIRFESIGPP